MDWLRAQGAVGDWLENIAIVQKYLRAEMAEKAIALIQNGADAEKVINSFLIS